MRLMAGDCARAGAGAARAPARRVSSRLRSVVMAYLAWGRGLQIIAHSKAAIDGLARLFSNHPPSIRAPKGVPPGRELRTRPRFGGTGRSGRVLFGQQLNQEAAHDRLSRPELSRPELPRSDV